MCFIFHLVLSYSCAICTREVLTASHIASHKRVSVSVNTGAYGRNCGMMYGGGQLVDFTPILLVLKEIWRKMSNVTLFY